MTGSMLLMLLALWLCALNATDKDAWAARAVSLICVIASITTWCLGK